MASDVAGWFFQQDYMTFLAILGWLTSALIAWGTDSAGTDRRGLPWRWFAFFCFFASLDGAIDLAKMVTPEIWPREIDPLFRLAGYGCLLEFSRRMIRSLRRMRVPVAFSAGIPTLALSVVFYHPAAAPVPEATVAFIAGLLAAVTISARVGRGTRPLLATTVAVALLGVVELLRGRGGVAIDGLYGLFVSGKGFEMALTQATLAWVSSGGLWLHAVFRNRSVVPGAPTRAGSSLSSVILPGLIAATLVSGYFVVNWRSTAVREDSAREYLYRIRAAVLAVDAETLTVAMSGSATDTNSAAADRIRRQLSAVLDAADDIARVYLWRAADGLLQLWPDWIVTRIPSVGGGENAAVKSLGPQLLTASGKPFLIGPVGTRLNTVLLVNVPVLDTNGDRQLAWMGAEIVARDWLTGQASVRLQTIALVGLFASLVVFFLAHQILRDYEGELLLAKERAEAADRAKDEFLAVMSHEIRTPMQSVLGYSELLVRSSLTDSQRDHVDTIRGQGRTLLRVVQDILDFSTLRKASYELKEEEINLHRLVQSAFGTIRPLAERRNLSFDLRVADNVPKVVLGDGVRIEQVLLNLMGNAVKFTDRGGVTLDVEMETDPECDLGSGAPVRFTVGDTGMGIRKDDIRRLFEPFIRLTYADDTRREGAGLGLAIVKRICELMGGSIDLESEWGNGTRFFVRIPLPVVDRELREGDPAPGHVGDHPLGMVNLGAVLPLNVLVAEDNPYIRRLMIEYLRQIGYEPVAAETGAEAAQRWREFDLILMDLRMPSMDGITATKVVRKACGDPRKPWIIGVSATLSDSEISRAMHAGMNDFLGKPFFVQSLVDAIEASPLYGQRTGEPTAVIEDSPAPENAPSESTPPAEPESSDAVPETTAAALGGMSWMPDLSAGGDTSLIDEAVAEIPGLLDEIEAALADGDVETAADRTHYLKNTVFALRIQPMVEPCREVYARTLDEDAPGAATLMGGLRSAFETWQVARQSEGPPGQPPGLRGA